MSNPWLSVDALDRLREFLSSLPVWERNTENDEVTVKANRISELEQDLIGETAMRQDAEGRRNAIERALREAQNRISELEEALSHTQAQFAAASMATEPDVIKVPTGRYHEMVADAASLTSEIAGLRRTQERMQLGLTEQGEQLTRMTEQRDTAEQRAELAEATVVDQAIQLTSLRSTVNGYRIAGYRAEDHDLDD